MSRRDVDLVIRARDEAAKVVETITKTLQDFNAAQGKVVSGASKTKESMADIAGAFQRLDSAMKGMQAAARITAEMDKAQASTERVRNATQETATELGRLKEAETAAATAAANLTRKYDGAARALKAQKAALDQARAAQGTLKAEVHNTSAALTGLQKTFERQTEAISKQESRVLAAADRYERLAKSVEAAKKPTKVLVRSMEAAERAVEKGTVKLNALRVAHAATGAEIERASVQTDKLRDRLDKSTARVDAQSRAVEKITQNHAKLRTQMALATREQKSLGDQVQNTQAVFQRQNNQLDKAQAELAQLGAAAAEASGKIAQLEAAGAKGLRLQIGQQARSVRAAAEEQAKAAAEANRLASEIGKVGVPTRQMAQAFELAKAASARAKQEFILQRDALGNMRQAMAQAGSSAQGLAAAQQRMAQVQAQTGAGIAQVRSATDTLGASIRRLFAETEKTSNSQRQYASSTRGAAAASQQATTATGQLRAAYQALYGESRQALSLTQRWRGEVLALVSAYAGFYGVVNILKQTVGAFQTLEAAQSRLNVVMDGDTAATAAELDWIRRNAELLGIEFGVLANQYTKFAVAAKGTNLEGENTRKIFLAVAAAARVNKASNEQIEGTFLALEQMVSKGAVSMEELRRQLGDRLPGAVQIMADAVGVGVEELTKMVELGQVSSDYLVQFAEQLDTRFGPGLELALKSTTTEIGRLQNATFQALLTFGKAGFMESFTRLVQNLTEVLKSAEFESFISRMSRLAAVFLDAISLVIDNFTLFATVAGAALGVKLIKPVSLLVSALWSMSKAAAAAAAGVSVFGRSAVATAGGMAATTAAVGRLTTAIRLLMASTGIGLAVVAATAAAAYFLTSADEATEAMVAHRAVVDDVKTAYEAAGEGAVDWAKAIKQTTRDAAASSLRTFQQDLERARVGAASFVQLISRMDPGAFGAPKTRKAVEDLTQLFRDGGISVEAYRRGLKDLFDGDATTSKTLLRELERTTEEGTQVEKAAREAEAALVLMSENASEAAKEAARAVLGIGETASEAAKRVERELDAKTKSFAETLETIKGLIPEVGEELEYLAKSKALDDLEAKVLRTAGSFAEMAEAFGLIDRARGALDAEYLDKTVSGSLVDRIIGVESGGNPNAKNPLSSATGLGQFIESTWLTMFKKYFPDRAAGMSNAAILALRVEADLSRKMTELYLRENAAALKAAGVAITDANLYLSHFLGPGGAVKVAKANPTARLEDMFAPGVISANRSIMQGRTAGDLQQWAARKVGVSGGELSVQEAMLEVDKKAAAEAERKAEAVTQFREQTAQSIEDSKLELSLQNASNVERETALAIREAERRAAAAGTTLTDEERRRITEITRQKFAQKDLDEAQAATRERVQKAEEAVNQLLEQRTALQEQMQIATQNQDAEGAEALRAKIAEVNTQLVAAIVNAQEMWKAVGGQAAESAIARLETAKLKAQEFGNEGKKSWVDWNRVGELFVGGLTNAFDRFAQSVAEGKSAAEAAREAFLQFAADFLREIAQMIIRQALLNALQGTKLGGLFQVPVAHSGLRVGSQTPRGTRGVNPAVFAGAQRFHTGGFPGLRPNEVPIIAEKGEEVLDKNDPRNALNGGAAPAAAARGANMKIVNMLGGRDIAEAITADDDGSEVLINWFRANKTTVAAILGG